MGLEITQLNGLLGQIKALSLPGIIGLKTDLLLPTNVSEDVDMLNEVPAEWLWGSAGLLLSQIAYPHLRKDPENTISSKRKLIERALMGIASTMLGAGATNLLG
ncbi:hypothetical protein KC717_07000, partial [Candidatus Dojkabacteria bacterium]|nr:hypothetical protein [Candidatus Dojkabacteria bacterium]